MKKLFPIFLLLAGLFVAGCNSTGQSRNQALQTLTNEPNRKISERIIEPVGRVVEYTAYWQVTEGEGDLAKTITLNGILKSEPGKYPALVIAKDGKAYMLDKDTKVAIVEEIIKEGLQPSVTYHGVVREITYDPRARVQPPDDNGVWVSGINNATRLGAYIIGGDVAKQAIKAGRSKATPLVSE